MPELQVVIEGVFEPRRFLDLVRDFIVFEDDGGGALVKKMAGYHQFHAVQVAVRRDAARGRARRSADRVAEDARALRGRAASPAASPATGASASSGTRRARARA